MPATRNPVPTSAPRDAKLLSAARARGTPLYAYDLTRLRTQVAEYQQALTPLRGRLLFATMANDCPPVLRTLRAAGVGACVNSGPHLALALDAGFSVGDVQYTSTGMSPTDMKRVHELGVRANLDSLHQLDAWVRLGGREAGVRVNAAALGRGAESNRIGMSLEDIAAAAGVAASAGGRVVGLHIYVGTNFQSADEMLPTLAAFFNLAEEVEGLKYVNIGGGIGVDYSHTGPGFDFAAFCRGLEECTETLRSRRSPDVEVIFEPGRSLTAECGTFVTTVTDVKSLCGRRVVAVDGSVSVFPRPLHQPETPHRVRHLTGAKTPGSGRPENIAMVVGRTTFSRDILGTVPLPDDIRVGDLLAFDDAGAYSQSMASRFLGQPEPATVFLDD